MRNLFEKIRDEYRRVVFGILFAGLFVWLFWLLSGSQLIWQASEAGSSRVIADKATAQSGRDADEETETLTEAVTEEMSETQSEYFTPAELAALEREMETEEETAAETEEEKTALWIAALRPADFRIPMAAPDTELVEYQEDLPARRWEIVSDRYRISGSGSYDLVEVSPASGDLVEVSPALEDLAEVSSEGNADNEIVGYGAYRPFGLLKKMVENRIARYDGDWSVYVKNLKTDESFVVNDRPMKSASVMKLFILGTVYKAIEAGELERTDEVVSLMNSMITASDNEASNRLLYLLGNSSYADGIACVDAFIQEYGFSDMTVEYNGFNNSATVLDSGHNNQVAAKDCGKLLEDIYRRTLLNRTAANEIEQMMLNQQTRYKIPAGLPEGVACGNKTGEMDTTENDAAVVYAKNCDYILVVLSSDWGSKDQAISRIASMSNMVYEFLN